MPPRTPAALLVLMLVTPAAYSAERLSCAVEKITDAYQCVRLGQIKERDGIRTTKLFAGGPNGVTDTGYTVAVNCRSQVIHLKDRQGVSFGGGSFGDTKMTRDLSRLMCLNATR